MELLEGMTLLYSEHHTYLALRIIGIAVIVITAAMSIYLVVDMVKEKYLDLIALVLAITVLGCGLGKVMVDSATPDTSYYILVDESVSYIEMNCKYGKDNIKHQGGNVYKITVEETE